MPSGRPKKNTKLIEVNDVRVEYITTKEDNYKNKVSYLKVLETKKLKPILEQASPEWNLPLWLTDEDSYIVKVKGKFMPKNEYDYHEILNASFEFKQYSFTNDDDKLIQGYYVSKFLGNEIKTEQC